MDNVEPDELEIFVAAHELPTNERDGFLERACAGNELLQKRVRSLLDASESKDPLLDPPRLATTVVHSERETGDDSETVIGKYKLLERIGEGGMAVVYMAEQEQPVRRRVAIKLIKPGMDSDSVVARFEAERQALARMDHPHIAKIFDGGATERGRPYFAMELVRGIRITDYCDQNRLSTNARLALFIHVCRAVQHAHQKGVIHRDLKPSNILVTQTDGSPVPKVIDFGIAKAIRDPLTDKTLFTRFHFFVGTPAYMSPEQAQMGTQDIDTRTDIYALGTLLYELLSGRTPFDPEQLSSLEDVRRTILEEEPRRPSSRLLTASHEDSQQTASRRRTQPNHLVRALRADLDWIAMKCLEKDRARRYESADALAQDVEHYLAGDAVVARPPSTIYRTRKFVRRNKVTVAIASIVMFAAVVSTWQAIRATLAVWEQNRLKGEVESALNLEAEQRRRAEREEVAALRRAYNSDMTLGQLALSANNYGRVVDLLDRNRPKARGRDFRQWEWRYFWNQVRSEAKFALPQQSDAIAGLAVSRNLRVLVTTELSGRLKLWDLSNQSVLMEYEERGFKPHSFGLSGDGKRLATVVQNGNQSTVSIWSVAKREVENTFDLESWVNAISFSPGGESLVVFTQDQSVVRWDLRQQKLVSVLRSTTPRIGTDWTQARPVLSADNSFVAYVSRQRIKVKAIESGEIVADIKGFEGGTWSLAFSGDGKTLAAGPSSSATSTDIRIFSLETGEELHRLTGHASWVPALTFTSRGTELVSAGADQTVRIWNVKQGTQRAVLRGHRSEIYRVVASANGDTIVSGAKDGTLLAWNANQVPRRERFESLPIPVTQLAFVPNSASFLLVDVYGGATLWDSETLQPIEAVTALGEDVKRLLVSSDGARVYSMSSEGSIRVLDWPTRQLVTMSDEDEADSAALVGLIDRGRSLVLKNSDSALRLVDAASFRVIGEWNADRYVSRFGTIASVAADAGLLAIGGVRQPLHLIDMKNDQIRAVPSSLPWGASDIAFAPAGRQFATASLEGTIRVWDSSTLKVVKELRGHLIGVNAVVYSPDGQRIASASQGDEAVKLWDAETGQEVATLRGEGLISRGLIFSPDGKLLVGINAQGKAHIWRAPPFETIAVEESRENMKETDR